MNMKEMGFIALDGMNFDEAWKMAERCRDLVQGVKGNTLLHMQPPGGTAPTAWYTHYGVPFFADAKFHDIPQTVANSVAELARQGATLITVHASGGRAMMRSAVEAYRKYRPQNGLGILAVTILTSLSPEECVEIYGRPPEIMVPLFARWAMEAGCFGIVCSAQELKFLAGDEFRSLKKVVAGVRLVTAMIHDQKRVSTPGNAIRDGANILVIGRDVTTAPDPIAAIAAIDEDINAALSAAGHERKGHE